MNKLNKLNIILRKLFTNLKKYLGNTHATISPQLKVVVIANIILLAFEFFYLYLRYKYLNNLIPLWYTKPWGDDQLAFKKYIVLIPVISTLITTSGIALIYVLKKYYLRYSSELILIMVSGVNIGLYLQIIRIINIASEPFKPLIDQNILDLLSAFILSVILTFIITPRFITFARKKGIVTDPRIHAHPGMALAHPSARGGGVVFTLCVVIASVLVIVPSKQIIGILLATALLALIGYLDDYQNTHQKSVLNKLESPVIRLALLFIIIISTITIFDINASYIGNPLGGIITFSNNTITVLGFNVQIVATLFTAIWIVWVLNLLSWSNGIDGQYSGIVGIAGIIIMILALRFTPLKVEQFNYAKLAIIMAGTSFGLTFFTWHPSKIMWGFSAMSAGIIITMISILINSKIATSILILMIPFLDATVTFIRRILQGKFPLKGDRGHLHHLLIERKWSIKKIAVFYWVSTAIFGAIGVLSSESQSIKIALTLGGIVGFFIILLNVQSITKKQKRQITEL